VPIWREWCLRRAAQSLTLCVIERENLTPDTFRFRLAATGFMKHLASFQPGQHVVLDVPDGNGRLQRRAYSLAAWQVRPGFYELAIKREADGQVSRWLHEHVRDGLALSASRPKGEFHWGLAGNAAYVALVAGGIGITPMRAMLQGWAAQPCPPQVSLHFSARSREQLYFDADFRAFAAAHSWFRYRPRLTGPDEAWDGASGRLDAAALLVDLPDPAQSAVFLCANQAMEDAVVAGLEAAGFPPAAVHRESFGIEAGANDIQATITCGGRSFAYAGAPTLLHALLDQGFDIPAECRAGECGACRVTISQGRVRNLLTGEVWETEALACCVVPEGDLKLGGIAIEK
jgi:ferredoxin-NADP reductase